MRPTTATRCGLTLLALLSVMPADAQDIRGLERVTLETRDRYGVDGGKWSEPNDSRQDSASASYNGDGPFEGLGAAPSPDLSGVCGIWGCDRASASASHGSIGAYMDQVNDAGGAGASARIVYRCPGTGTVQMLIHSVYQGGSPIEIYRTDGSWSCSFCAEKFPILEIPAGGDVAIEASTVFDKGGSSTISFSLVPAEGDAEPFVVSASVAASAYCLVTTPQDFEEPQFDWFDTIDIPCGEAIDWGIGKGFAGLSYEQSAPAAGAAPWTSVLDFYATGTSNETCYDQGIATARLELSAPIILSSLTPSGGTLRIDGTPTPPSAFPRTLATGQHTLEYVSNSIQWAVATLSILTSDDPDSLADCNGNGFIDGCEIFSRDVADADRDWVPDSCEHARGDLNLDDIVNAADLTILLAQWGAGASIADLNADGTVNAADLTVLLARWTAGG
jgi:hypothetical protein